VIAVYARKGVEVGATRSYQHIDVRISEHGRPFGPLVSIAANATVIAPKLVVAANGDAVLSFDEKVSGGWQVTVATRLAGHRFTVARPVAGARTGARTTPAVAVDSAGEVAVAWAQGGSVLAATGTVDGGLAPAQTISGTPASPVVAVGDGRAVVGWTGPEEGGEDMPVTCAAALAPLGRAFSSPTTLSSSCGELAGPPAFTITSDGYAIAAFGLINGTPTDSIVQTVVAPPNGGFGPPQTEFTGYDVLGLQLAAGQHGDALLALLNEAKVQIGDPASASVDAAVSTSQGVFGPIRMLTSGSYADLEAIGIGPHGELDVAWSAFAGSFIATASES
jgi:hypothetical protein